MKTEEEYKAEVLQLMCDLYPTLKGEEKERAERLFPELKESEDERIRKWLIGYFNQYIIDGMPQVFGSGLNIKDVITWLEKQGEQKPAYKVEPKFKVGDWITNGKCIWKIDSIDEDMYYTNHCGIDCGGDIKSIDEEYHLWTIQDAKDGDLIYVSTEEKGIQAIFREYKDKTIFFHCFLCCDFVQGGYMPIGSVELMYPLQKTHYKRFFEKMDEAGYQWNAEELKVEKIERKQEWSEEDEAGLSDVLWAIEQARTIAKDENDMGNLWCAEKFAKSIKDRYTWKPSEEMLEALYKVIPQNVMAISEDEILLDKLYQGLKYGRVLSKN